MKLKHILGTVGIASALAIAVPTTTFALDISSAAKIHIEDTGAVHVSGAEVTSVSGNIINAVTRFKDSVVNMVVTTNAATTIAANNSKTGTMADITVGDKLNISGMLTGFGSSVSLTATKIKDISSMQYWRLKAGTIATVSPSTNSFTIKQSNNTTLTVQLNASTTVKLANNATGTISTLKVGDRVKVSGFLRSDNNSTLVASAVQVKDTNKDKRKEGRDNNKKADDRKNHRHLFFKSKNEVHLENR